MGLWQAGHGKTGETQGEAGRNGSQWRTPWGLYRQFTINRAMLEAGEVGLPWFTLLYARDRHEPRPYAGTALGLPSSGIDPPTAQVMSNSVP